jgi:hypothetical protein
MQMRTQAKSKASVLNTCLQIQKTMQMRTQAKSKASAGGKLQRLKTALKISARRVGLKRPKSKKSKRH